MSIIHWEFSDWMDNVALAALSSKETVYASYDIARLAIERGVPGDFVECGVFGGAQCAVMARAIMDCAPATRDDRAIFSGGSQWIKHYDRGDGVRRVHLFDSFAGVPAPGPEDEEWLAAGHPVGLSACPLEECQRRMREWGIPDELLVWHEGLFKDTTVLTPDGGGMAGAWWRGQDPKRIAVLRLDADLYDSTRVCLENLYPLVSPGGWLIIDDWNLSGCRKAVEEFMNPAPIYWQKG